MIKDKQALADCSETYKQWCGKQSRRLGQKSPTEARNSLRTPRLSCKYQGILLKTEHSYGELTISGEGVGMASRCLAEGGWGSIEKQRNGLLRQAESKISVCFRMTKRCNRDNCLRLLKS